MSPGPFKVGLWVTVAFASLADGHMVPWHKGMYALNGTVPGVVNFNNGDAATPLYQLPYNKFWMHAVDGVTLIPLQVEVSTHRDVTDSGFPPAEQDFVELRAGRTFTVEIAENRAFTSLYPHAHQTSWGDGLNHPDDYSITNLGGLQPTPSGCIPSPNLHAQNESMAAGTAFAISYEPNIDKVTPENLTVFTVRHHTPWRRETTYDVPSGLPACPKEGCIIVFVWIPDGCGQPNMYMYPYRARVIPDSSTPKTIGKPKPPVWCEDDPSKCVQGPKQMLIWQQLEGNNIAVDGYDVSGQPKSPAYNQKCGFKDGAQNDIFVESCSNSKRMMTRHAKKNSVF